MTAEGSGAGEVASALAVEAIQEPLAEAARHADLPLIGPFNATVSATANRLASAIRSEAGGDNTTTVVVVALKDDFQAGLWERLNNDSSRNESQDLTQHGTLPLPGRPTLTAKVLIIAGKTEWLEYRAKSLPRQRHRGCETTKAE